MTAGGKEKFYVVWSGHNPGVYASWGECRREVEGFGGAAFKSFSTKAEAEREFMLGNPNERSEEVRAYAEKTKACAGKTKGCALKKSQPAALPAEVELRSLAVDAACSGNPGMMEYRGVFLQNGGQAFHYGPVWGTNNIGEFLAIVHALALMRQKGMNMPVYSDSHNAILWVRKGKCATKLKRDGKSRQVYELINRAERWLADNKPAARIIKWKTSDWGEIPADFGRKH